LADRHDEATWKMNLLEWLLDSDPSIRWQAMRDLLGEPDDLVAAERARVATVGWGARLLSERGSDGQWAGGAFFPSTPPTTPGQPWTATFFTLVDLMDLGLDPDSPQARETVALVRENSRWDHDGQRFFDGEVEPCINGRTVGLGAYFGEDVTGIVDRLLTEQMDDGGWNCEQENGAVRGSFHTTINVLEGFIRYEVAIGETTEVTTARNRGEEYLLERRLLRRLTTGGVIDSDWTLFSYPTRWHYDVLRGLDYLRTAGVEPDARVQEAVELVETKRERDGRWLLENTHPGNVHFHMEEEGLPSRWNTLRSMRVLEWAGRENVIPSPVTA
jgi:hypothetical protein